MAIMYSISSREHGAKMAGGLIKDGKWKTSLAPLSGIFGNQFFSSWTLILFYFSFGVGGVMPRL